MTHRNIRKSTPGLSIVLMLLFVVPQFVKASMAADTAAAEFFKGATIRVVVPFAPGGTGDTAARVPAALFSKYTGGRVVVENMPGAGGYSHRR